MLEYDSLTAWKHSDDDVVTHSKRNYSQKSLSIENKSKTAPLKSTRFCGAERVWQSGAWPRWQQLLRLHFGKYYAMLDDDNFLKIYKGTKVMWAYYHTFPVIAYCVFHRIFRTHACCRSCGLKALIRLDLYFTTCWMKKLNERQDFSYFQAQSTNSVQMHVLHGCRGDAMHLFNGILTSLIIYFREDIVDSRC